LAYEVMTRARDPRRPAPSNVWRLSAENRIRVHQNLFELSNQTETSYRADLDAFHHGILSQRLQPSGAERRLHFVEQLQEIGRSLSYVFRQHRQAADVFRLALGLDDQNAYSHHYLAFNLDWDAESEEEVEFHYQEAIRLQPEHPWWWSRWISYLATRGRFKAAGAQWREALDALSVAEDSTPQWIYLSLHRWVARWVIALVETRSR
jgi:tetratricopeptide (TPR) repeat protein